MHILIAPDSYKGFLNRPAGKRYIGAGVADPPGGDGSHPAPCLTEARDLAPAVLTPVMAISFTQMPLTYMAIQYKHPCTPGAIRR